MPFLPARPASVMDYRTLAKKRLPNALFDYIDGGAYNEYSANENVRAFNDVQLRQRILRDVSSINTESMWFGEKQPLPVALGPIGLTGMFARRGEVQAQRAAEKKGIPFCLSTVGVCSIEELARHASAPFWFQLYVLRDRDYALKLLQRAQDAGCTTLVFTVDLPVVGDRYRDVRNGISGKQASVRRALDFISHPRWLWDVAIKGRPLSFGNVLAALPEGQRTTAFKAWVDEQFDPSITWQDLHWLRDHWKGNLIIKGILSAEDAQQAAQLGADAVVVSNHGGRQLDGATASVHMLPEIVKVLSGRTRILLDGGIRSGLDVVKALALGADGCLLGRAWSYALAANGQAGVEHVLDIIEQEMRTSMALMGVTQLSELSPQRLRHTPHSPLSMPDSFAE